MPAASRPQLPPTAAALADPLRALFDAEAASRTRAQDAALLDAAIAAAEAARPLETERRRLEAALGRGFPVAA